jgi:replicative DNA helicase
MNKSSNLPPVFRFADLITDFVADAEAAAFARASGNPRGVVTCFENLDQALGGYLAQGIHVLQAAPGAGKTAFALQVAASCGFPALFVSVEMGLLELFRRTIARVTSTSLTKIKSGEISPQEARRLALITAEKIPKLALMDATQCYAAPSLIVESANLLREHFQSEHVLIELDSLHAWARSSRAFLPELAMSSEYELINAALESVSGIAAQLKCPILLIAHRNREGNKSKDASMHTAKGSGDVEYIAETIIDLTRKGETDAAGERDVTAFLHKNRNGEPGLSFNLKFHGNLQRFKEV